MTGVALAHPEGQETQRRRRLKANLGLADRVFRAVARGGGALVLVIMTLVGLFLTYRALQALRKAGPSFLTTQEWNPDSGEFGIAAVILGTVLIAIVAIVVATVLSVGVALYISEFAPFWLRRTLIAMVDLMAAVPSVVFGLWGAFFLQWKVLSLSRWISDWFGWIPIFKVNGVTRHDPLATETVYTSSTFIAGLVVALMVAPIACSVMREAFSQAPAGEREGAYALGATRWGMIGAVVLPFGKGAIIGGTMLGLGRALGETIAVVMIISPVFVIQPRILENGTSSVSSLIATHYGESSPFALSALFAAGLALFAVTLVVNFIAASIVARSRSGAVSEV
ncbi:phosphate ABC transporter permease subunit PstC [Phytohabitans sp. ZYX-F-186]|uniref:Phosphate transport system permease protein n=1 Tax=Phytohabitans maris TaxID=3071409 RepID=A0ABU0ZW34_9ACTN|nr:phosphate ABC transporter permease subunit PstC [Phytohabitans sp. ZYX-F-186]MDQ7911140.1 phosphate ABC transporter permease subunit PstC [Phytohabitans sp. ZYX-F-186]